jgi:hypothetical protein
MCPLNLESADTKLCFVSADPFFLMRVVERAVCLDLTG